MVFRKNKTVSCTTIGRLKEYIRKSVGNMLKSSWNIIDIY
jgi:hypothetical protein